MEFLLTLLAAVGLLALGWVLFGKLVAPVGGKESPIYAVIPASGGGDGLFPLPLPDPGGRLGLLRL